MKTNYELRYAAHPEDARLNSILTQRQPIVIIRIRK